MSATPPTRKGMYSEASVSAMNRPELMNMIERCNHDIGA